MTQAGDHNEDDIALVGEYALHLLDADERLAFETRLVDDAGLRVLLREWDEGLVSLADEIAPVAPPPRLKAGVEERLFGKTERFSLRNFFGMRGALLGMAMVAMVAVIVVPQMMDQGPRYTAEIAAEDRALVVEAVFDADKAEIAINRTAGAAVPGRALELWLIADGAEAPVSLGVMPVTELASISVPDELLAAMVGGTLAISDEPLGGSPTGAPTGAVLAVGAISLL